MKKIFRGSCLFIIACIQVAIFAQAPVRGIKSSTQNADWTNGLLSGNGTMGVIVLGNPLSETFIFNHQAYLVPDGGPVAVPKTASILSQMQDKMLAGDYSGGQNLFVNTCKSQGLNPLVWTQSFHPGYKMMLSFPQDNNVSKYERSTNFETGEVLVTYTDNRGDWVRKTFVSRADSVVVTLISKPVSTTNAKINCTIQLSQALVNVRSDISYSNMVDTSFLNLRGRYSSGGSKGGYEGVTQVIVKGGTKSIAGTVVTIASADTVLLLTKLDRYKNDYTVWNNKPIQNFIAKVKPDYDYLLARHVAIVSPLYKRVRVDFNALPEDRALTTEQLLAKEKTNKKVNPALLEKMFDAGRYYYVSSSGYFPPRLSGLWLGEWGASWSDDFTTNINVNLQIASGSTGNLPESMESYFAMIDKQYNDWKVNAQNLYGCRGVLAPSRTDGENGFLFHFDATYAHNCWTAGGAWLIQPFYEYYCVTGDEAFLANRVLPKYKDLALFYEDFLKRTDSNGKYLFVPSYSPENAPSNTSCQASVNATMDIAAAKEVLTTLVKICNHLKVEQGSGGGVEKWTAMLAKIPPYLVNSDNAIKEWSLASLNNTYDHRHVSHFYPLWPGFEITPDNNKTMCNAITTYIDKSGYSNWPGHGLMHRIFSCCRLKDPTRLYKLVQIILSNDYIYSSLFTSHDANHTTFNADIVNSLWGAMIEMLVYSDESTIEILPALMSHLTKGSMSGVLCRNQITIDSLMWDVNQNNSAICMLTSAIDQKITFVYRKGFVNLRANVPIESSPLGTFAKVMTLKAHQQAVINTNSQNVTIKSNSLSNVNDMLLPHQYRVIGSKFTIPYCYLGKTIQLELFGLNGALVKTERVFVNRLMLRQQFTKGIGIYVIKIRVVLGA